MRTRLAFTLSMFVPALMAAQAGTSPQQQQPTPATHARAAAHAAMHDTTHKAMHKSATGAAHRRRRTHSATAAAKAPTAAPAEVMKPDTVKVTPEAAAKARTTPKAAKAAKPRS